MNAAPIETHMPPGCRLAPAVATAGFHVCWQIPDPRLDDSALETWLALAAATRAWMSVFMAMRNRTVGVFGLVVPGLLRNG